MSDYDLRVNEHLGWREVGERLGLSPRSGYKGAEKRAKKHALANDLPWPPVIEVQPKYDVGVVGGEAYRLANEGLTRTAIANQMGIAETTVSRYLAMYSESAGVPLPELHVSELNVRGRAAYEARLRGGTWGDVADEVGYTYPTHATTGAKRYALANDLPWPMKVSGRWHRSDVANKNRHPRAKPGFIQCSQKVRASTKGALDQIAAERGMSLTALVQEILEAAVDAG